ncbi:MAG: M20/M25/M40 family metallo-hydrolase [Candidatus Aminicenantes bacterium]|nr:M20/M25/M40 family metallo-hydrolase [Candidatus Aminicenantes bacterium]
MFGSAKHSTGRIFLVSGITSMLLVSLISGQKRIMHADTAQSLLKLGLTKQYTYAILRQITDTGPRLAGSPQAAAAVELTRQLMLEFGFESVHLEPTVVPHWIRGSTAEAHLISSTYGSQPLSIAAIGGSIGTPENGIVAQVVEVQNFPELRDLGDKARGKIIFFNRPLDPSLINTFSAYGQAASQRTQGAVEASKVGAVGALVRSLTTSLDDHPHTGMLRYSPATAPLPAACVSTQGADILSRTLRLDPELRLHMNFSCRHLEDVQSYNVVGQITGSDHPDEIVLLGGHLDCWDLSHGAHDDGAGCAQSLAALLLLKKLGIKPKRTIRAVMFMNEEFGGSGGIDYAASSKRQKEVHLAALESDRGGFLPLSLGIGGSEERFNRFKNWEPLFQDMGLMGLRRGGGGVDIGPLGKSGTVLCGLVPDSQRYFHVHHSAKDILSSVNPRELELGTIAMALWAYLVAQEGI